MLNNYFATCFNKSCNPLNVDQQPLVTTPFPEELLCNEEEVEELLSSVDVSKASGPDDISAKMLKNTAPCIGSSITKLFNQFLTAGKIPSQWKESIVIPIPKSDNHNTPTNYRPISLLSILSKLLERNVHRVILDHLDEHYPLSNRQWGFTEGRGTVTSLITTTHDWLYNLNQGNDICVVFFDYKKAFDSVPHGPLMDKPCCIGLNKYILRWIWNYLSSNRLQKVVVNGSSLVKYGSKVRNASRFRSRTTALHYVY